MNRLPVPMSTATASWLNAPIAGRTVPWPACCGSHSHTWPVGPFSSHDSHVPHGVGPPAQLSDVPERMRYAPSMVPSAAKVTADAPPAAPPTSELDTYTQPPPGRAKHAPPSGAPCQL